MNHSNQIDSTFEAAIMRALEGLNRGGICIVNIARTAHGELEMMCVPAEHRHTVPDAILDDGRCIEFKTYEEMSKLYPPLEESIGVLYNYVLPEPKLEELNVLEVGYGNKRISKGERKLRKAKRGW